MKDKGFHCNHNAIKYPIQRCFLFFFASFCFVLLSTILMQIGLVALQGGASHNANQI